MIHMSGRENKTWSVQPDSGTSQTLLEPYGDVVGSTLVLLLPLFTPDVGGGEVGIDFSHCLSK